MGGLRYVMGEPDRMPSRAGISIGDTLAATYACMGALAALEHRHKTGKGQIVDSAIYEACFAMMESLIPDYQFGDYVRERTGAFLPKIAPSNIYPASDGMLIIAANQDSVWQRLAEAMGRAELGKDERYATRSARGERQAELDAMIAAWSKTKTCAELESLCEAHGVPCGRIYRAPDMLEDPHFAAREAIVAVEHPVLGAMKMQNAVPKFSATPGNVRWTGPALGEHTDEVLHSLLGYTSGKIEALRASNVI
jgi:crotonobetainyl-CoA:carnitine CoA-transferase CaiB-like acyl-CoA transferase